MIGLIAIIAYFLLLFLIKKTGFGKKKTCENCNNCCPNCQSPLNRVQRKLSDRFIHQITFRFFDFKRYICNDCGWEGTRWQEKFKTNKD